MEIEKNLSMERQVHTVLDSVVDSIGRTTDAICWKISEWPIIAALG